MIIDTHVHVFKKFPYSSGKYKEFSPDILIKNMDEAGVSRAILISYEIKEIMYNLESRKQVGEFITGKEYALKGFNKYSDRLIWFTYGFDCDNKNFLEVVKNDVENGARGIKLFPSLSGFSLDDKRLIPLFEYCQKENLPIILSLEYWNDLNRPPHTNDYNEYKVIILKLIKKYNKIKFLFCHFGCFNWSSNPNPYFAKKEELYKNLEGFIELMSYHNVWTDISAMSFCYGEPFPFPTAQKLIKCLINEIPIEKIMFGSDWPGNESYCTYKQLVDIIRFSDFLTDKQKKYFLELNAKKFLDIK